MQNYENISQDDIHSSIQDEEYLKTQVDKFNSYIPNVKGLNVAEVGVGKGLLLGKLLKEDPKKLIGIDISLSYLNLLKEKIDVFIANAENIPFQNFFDVIIASDVIEHVLNPGNFLISANRALNSNGLLIVKTPFNEDINSYSMYRGCKYDFVHLRNFDKKTLTTILKGSGFKITRVIYDGFDLNRFRKFFRIFKLDKVIRFFLRKFYHGHYSANQIPNFIGKILMIPIEITVIAKKS